MQLNKPAGADLLKNSGIPVNDILIKTPVQAKTPSLKSINAQMPRNAAALLTALGLPQDRLSNSVLSLARFFSLPLKPQQLETIRRAAMSAHSQGQAAFSLAAAAAESKSVELNTKGLEMYVNAIDPDSEKKHDGEKQDRRRQRDQSENKDNINAVNIKKIAMESAEENSVLSIMNKLPGKNGQHWIVLPFEFYQNKKKYCVSMRVLMEGSNAVIMVLDIKTISNEQLAVNSEQLKVNNDSRRSFALEFINNKLNKLIYYTQEKTDSAFSKDLAAILGLPVNNIHIKTGENNILPEADCGESLLQFIDEVV